jgi:hypothetical protein
MKLKRSGIVGIIALCMILTVMGSASAEVPPTPASLTVDVSGGWVNYTWTAGSGVVTDSYNTSISVSGGALTWTNTTATTSNNNVGLDEWAEIWVYAYNDTDDGNLSATYAHLDTQADRSRFGELIDLLVALPDVLTPILAVIVILIIIMAFVTIGYLITGTIDGITEAIKEAIRFKK